MVAVGAPPGGGASLARCPPGVFSALSLSPPPPLWYAARPGHPGGHVGAWAATGPAAAALLWSPCVTATCADWRDGEVNRPSAATQCAVAVDLVILTVRDGQLCVLTVRTRHTPFEGKFALPGGFVLPDEDLTAAAYRELAEEAGLKKRSVALEQLRTFGAPARDPRGRVVSVAYLALGAGLADPRAGSDALSAQFEPVSEYLSRRAGPLALAFRPQGDPCGGRRAGAGQARIHRAGRGVLPAGVHRGSCAVSMRRCGTSPSTRQLPPQGDQHSRVPSCPPASAPPAGGRPAALYRADPRNRPAPADPARLVAASATRRAGGRARCGYGGATVAARAAYIRRMPPSSSASSRTEASGPGSPTSWSR